MANCNSATSMHIITRYKTQMFVCDRMYADYVVWTECDAHIERIERDEQLWKHVEPRAKTSFTQAILIFRMRSLRL